MTDSNVKWVSFLLLILLWATILGWGIWQYRQFYEWLVPRHIEGLVLMVLLAFGLTGLFVPVVVRQDWQSSSAKDVVVHYLAAFGFMFGALTAVFTLLWLLGWVWLYLRIFPMLLIILIAILMAAGYILEQKRKRESE